MSEHESDSSDDERRINEVTKSKKPKVNVTYQRAARPTTYDDDDDDDDDDNGEDDFNRQLRLEQTKKLQHQAEQIKTKTDPDGTVYEWDPTVKGWLVKNSFLTHLSFSFNQVSKSIGRISSRTSYELWSRIFIRYTI
jgi:hypothetical protein